MQISELEIAVPWGHLAAKTFGDDGYPVVLVFHGILDNAGSFNRLIPLLPKSYYYVCVDLPGHGRSSHFPHFFPYFTINNLFAYKLLVQYFKQDKYIILGHSYGAQIATLFTQLYPEYVEKLMMLDTVHLFPIHPKQYGDTLRDRIEYLLALDQKLKNGQPPSYTYDEVIYKLMNQRAYGKLDKEAAEALASRALIPTEEGKFRFSIDQRIKMALNPLHNLEYIAQTLKLYPIKCPVLLVLARESTTQRIVLKKIIKHYKSRRNYTINLVDGDHDVHNNNPELVAPLLNAFLLKKTAKL